MSIELIIGLLLQTIAVVLVMFRVRHRRLAYTGLLFVCISVIYSGFTELLQIAYPGMNVYRMMVNQYMVDRWLLVVSSAILIFAMTYSYRVRPLREKHEMLSGATFGFVDWRWGIGVVILLNLTLAGIFGDVDLGYWGGLSEMLPGFTNLILLDFILEKKGKYILPLFLYQSGIGMLSGSRSAVLFSLITLLCVFIRYGVSIRWRSLILSGITVLILAVSISGMRSVVGRYVFADQTNMQRLESLWAGAGVVLRYGMPTEIMQDIVYRFDGNSFGGLIVAGYEAGIEQAGWTPIINNFFLTVPSFLNPKKVEAGLFNLNEEDYLVDHFRMSGFKTIELKGELIETSEIDYIPGVWGILFGAFGTVGVLFSAALLGLGFAVMDTWIMRSRSLLAVLIGIGLTVACLLFEQGIRVFVLTGRAVLALFIVLILFRQAKTILVVGLGINGSQHNKTHL